MLHSWNDVELHYSHTFPQNTVISKRLKSDVMFLNTVYTRALKHSPGIHFNKEKEKQAYGQTGGQREKKSWLSYLHPSRWFVQEKIQSGHSQPQQKMILGFGCKQKERDPAAFLHLSAVHQKKHSQYSLHLKIKAIYLPDVADVIPVLNLVEVADVLWGTVAQTWRCLLARQSSRDIAQKQFSSTVTVRMTCNYRSSSRC